MFNPHLIDFDEGFWLLLLILEFICLFIWLMASPKARLAWAQPTIIASVIYFYYTILGPLAALITANYFDRQVNLRDAFKMGWQGAAVSFASFLIGYYFSRPRLITPKFISTFNSDQSFRLGLAFNLISICIFILLSGTQTFFLISLFLGNSQVLEAENFSLGGFYNYFALSVNLFIPGNLLLVSSSLKSRRNTPEVILWLIISSFVFILLGFRYRLAMLFAGIIIIRLLAKGRSPNLFKLTLVLLLFIFFAGLIVITRTYGLGLDLQRLNEVNISDVFALGLSESNIFLTSGAVMSLVPFSIPYAGITPFLNVLLFVIPASLLPSKNTFGYLSDAFSVVYGSATEASGAFILNYAEYFLIGGWPVVIAMNFILGFLFRRVWFWFYLRQQEPLAQVVYVTFVIYLYMIISRGYLAQVVMLFCYTVLPGFLAYYFLARPSKTF